MSRETPHIVLDARMAVDGGIGTYLQQLLPRIAGIRPWRFTLIGDMGRMQSLQWDRIPNVALQNSNAPIFSLREQLELPLRFGRGDLYWAPNYNVPVLSRVPLVVTVHDVNHVALPELLGGAIRRSYARWLLETAVRRSRRVLFDSEFTRAESSRLLEAPVDAKGSVVHLGVDAGWHDARSRAPQRPTPEPYMLYVGNVKRHKNVPFLLRAFARAMNRIPHRLILIGRAEGLRADPEVAGALAALGDRARFLGEMPHDDVERYVAHADALVTASRYEGFGLPALEAMAAGTPCLVSSAGSLPEICGDAALYGDPTDEPSFSERILEISMASDQRTRRVELGKARARHFTWERCARATAEVLEQALA